MGIFERIGTTRARLAWWLFVGALGAFVLVFAYAFVGTFTLGVFLYYASRPAFRRIRRRVDSDGLAAMVTLVGAGGPILLVLSYTGLTALMDLVSSTQVDPAGIADFVGRWILGDELSGSGEDILLSILRNPAQLDQLSTDLLAGLVSGGLQTIRTIGGFLVHVSLAFLLAFTLLRDGDDFAAWVLSDVAGDDETVTGYWESVDRNLQTVYFGNVLFVIAIAVVATVVYHGFNFLAPPGLTIPTPTLFALLTGIASLVPLLVGKIVYVPIVGFLALRAAEVDGGGAFAYPLGLLVCCFLVLDIVPQTFLQPYFAGRTIGTELMMFAYILGPLFFGWYGIFLLPLLLVLVVQAARIVLVELVRGQRITTEASAPMPGEAGTAGPPAAGVASPESAGAGVSADVAGEPAPTTGDAGPESAPPATEEPVDGDDDAGDPGNGDEPNR